ncbi:MAG TPA: sulfur carrier protein ThiS [Frankiaceae bacterium]|nr:sulfur carrier protein ThiS [Frankiaceae bacterium]
MTVTVNGEPREVADELPLPALLADYRLRPGMVVVERNGVALTRSEAEATVLADGDVLELVRAVAGG